jgi:hypothetical protein
MSVAEEVVDAVRSGDRDRARALSERAIASSDAGARDVCAALGALVETGDQDAVVVAGGLLRDLAGAGVNIDAALPGLTGAARGADERRLTWAWEALHPLAERASPEQFERTVAPLLETRSAEHWASVAKAAARRGLALGTGLRGLVALAGSGAAVDRAAARSALVAAAEGGQDLGPVLEDLRKLADGARVDPELADVLIRAEVGQGQWDRLDDLLAHRSPEVRKAASRVGRELAADALATARAEGDARAVRSLLELQRRLRT